MTEVRRK